MPRRGAADPGAGAGVRTAERPLDAPAEVKALLVALISVPAAFALGALLRRGSRRLLPAL